MKLKRIPFILAATIVLAAFPIWAAVAPSSQEACLLYEGDGISMGYFDDDLLQDDTSDFDADQQFEDIDNLDDSPINLNPSNNLYLISNQSQYDPRILFSVYGYGYLTVTDSNGGSIATGTYLAPGTRVNVRAENSYGSGFVFSGWEINGIAYPGQHQPRTRSFVVEENLYVTALFLDGFQGWPDANVNPSANTATHINVNETAANLNANTAETRFAVVFHANGGNLPSGIQAMQSKPLNTMLNSFPIPTREGYVFGGWMLNGSIAHAPLTITSDITLEAHWVKPPSQSNTNPSTTNPSDDYHVIAFNPAPGAFAGDETGIRVGVYGSRITDMPHAPTRENYYFEGWKLPNGHVFYGQLTITDSMTLIAVWNPSAACPPPSPTPAPSSTPTPSPSSAPGSAARPNPQTSPLQVSLLIFATVFAAGLAAFGILKLNRRHAVADGKYRADIARYNREKRLMNLMDEDN